MKCLVLAAAVLGFLIPSTSHAKSPLKRYLWENRLWVVFADTSSAPSIRKVESAIKAHKAGLAERHMVVIAVYRDRVETLFKNTASEDIRGGNALAQNLRRRLDVKAGQLRSFLIGKDTGVKSVSDVHRAIELFAQIDRMPMRRQEIRQQKRQRQNPS